MPIVKSFHFLKVLQDLNKVAGLRPATLLKKKL